MEPDIWVDLLREAGAAHHHAFASTDGDDPGWPDWYAGWLLDRLPEPRPEIDRADLAALLEEAAATHKDSGAGQDWPVFYARLLEERLEA